MLQNLVHFYDFPVQLLTELVNEAELVKYLSSAKAASLYNIPKVELHALAALTGGQIHVLSKIRGGSDRVLDLDETLEWKWTAYSPIAPEKINKQGRLYSGSDMYMITENGVHFYHLSGMNSTLPVTAAAEAATDEAIVNEAHEELDTERFNMVPIGTLTKEVEHDQTKPDEQDQNIHPLGSMELRRSTRTSKKTERYNSYQNLKRKASQSKTARKKNNTESSTDLSDINESLLDEDLRSRLEKARKMKEMRLRNEKENNRLREMGDLLRESLSNENMRSMLNDNIEYIRSIERGQVRSWRRDILNAGKHDELIFRQISAPFTDEHIEIVHFELRKHFMNNQTTPSRLIDFVLVPEVLLKIYATFFSISISEAEKNLMRQGIYRSNSNSSDEPFL